MTKANKEAVVLNWILCIYYPMCFWKDQEEVLALISLESEVNAITPAYTSKQGLKVHPINIRA